MDLLALFRAEGLCPPSLLLSRDQDELWMNGIENCVSGTSLINDTLIVSELNEWIKQTLVATNQKILIHRRAVVLAIVGSTSIDNVALRGILNMNNGFLFTVKIWLQDILENSIGGTDLLLHLLDNIASLPVDKEMVTSSNLGKKVAAIEKDKICVGSPNESAIRDRVSKVKEEWSASVKRMKKLSATSDVSTSESEDSSSLKRSRTVDTTGAAPTKKAKSLSSLLQQVSSSTKEDETLSAAEKARKRAQEKASELRARLAAKRANAQESGRPETVESNEEPVKKLKVKWADMTGGPLTVSHGGSKNSNPQDRHGLPHDWSDKKKIDKLKEKELLQRAKTALLDDENDNLDSMAMMYSSKWIAPKALPPDIDNAALQIDSNELNNQMKRILSTLPVNFLTEDDVPSDPNPLSEFDQALDISAQTNSIPEKITFIKSLAVPVAVPPPPVPAPIMSALSVPPPTPSQFGLASAALVQSMGLPPFLVGQNIQALQTLVASPGLLNAFVDAYGNYDQMKILNLVQTLTSTITGAPAPVPSIPPPPPQPFIGQTSLGYGHPFNVPPPAAQFQAPPPPPPPIHSINPVFSAAPTQSASYTVSSGEGNLHLSGYGPMTTQESIIQLFAPYVKIDEIVPKNGFMFINTSDPEGAQRAKEALSGVMVGGGPLRINPAVRRMKVPDGVTNVAATAPTTILPRNALGQIDYDAITDDRGNPATRNLFVAGYGPGTTEQMLRDAFSPYTVVTGIVQKTTFSFVNTSDRESAVQAREALLGKFMNGGALRINFAKETGRLGTTFDAGLNNQRIQAQGMIQTANYYGRS